MGMLVYNGRMTLTIDDRVLAHLQVVVINKLRRRESFTFTIDDGAQEAVCWIGPSIPLEFVYSGNRRPLLNREWRPEQLMRRAHTGGPIVAGVAFAVAWLPCTGPTLGAILTAASQESTVGHGGVLLAFYALGLAVPFILSALAFTTFSGVFRFFRDHYTAITLVSGVILVVMGVLLYTNELTRLNSEALQAMDDLNLNFFSEL